MKRYWDILDSLDIFDSFDILDGLDILKIFGIVEQIVTYGK